MVRDKVLQVVMSEQERDIVNNAAGSLLIPTSTWIRSLIIAHALEILRTHQEKKKHENTPE